MKFSIVVILVAFCGSALCGPSDWEDNLKQCSEKYKVKREDLHNSLNGKIKESEVTADMKCALLCLGEKDKLIKNGAFQQQNVPEAFANTATKDQIAKITADCNVKGTDDCDTAYKVGLCIVKIQTM
ncbi:general odorant-binding protein 56h [Episyrphus balteatus]|uniref:general odorant-binding protein 56h n=1 Tax=Episyrphus balteatus TaxID=286459 RepID=UPI0024856D31|nr:general odorant-binding protein 56h [Episyrphus balteatus]